MKCTLGVSIHLQSGQQPVNWPVPGGVGGPEPQAFNQFEIIIYTQNFVLKTEA